MNHLEKQINLENAGLILLHPFIETLFTKLGLLSESNRALNNKLLACQVLHFLATGHNSISGSSLLFEKYFCDIPDSSNVSNNFKTPESIKKECESLLFSVIDHWSSLKNISIESLRTNFLQRRGTIASYNEGYKIIMEQEAIDILLQKLPWQYNIIKFTLEKRLIIY